MPGGPAAVQQAGLAQHQYAIADADDGGAPCRLFGDEAGEARVVAVVHGRDDEVVRPVRVALFEGIDGGLGAHPQCRHQLHGAGLGGQGDHLAHLGAAEYREGHEEIHQFGHAVLGDHGDHRLRTPEARVVRRQGVVRQGRGG